MSPMATDAQARRPTGAHHSPTAYIITHIIITIITTIIIIIISESVSESFHIKWI